MTIKSQALFLSFILTAQISTYSQPSYCQEAKQTDSPEAVAKSSFKALQEGKPQDYIELMAPEEMERFKKGMMTIVEMAKDKGQEGDLLKLFKVESVDTLNKMGSKEFFLKILEMQMSPQTAQIYEKSKFDLVGSIKEGDDITHCVYLLDIGGWLKKHNIVSLKKSGEGWKMLLTSDMDKMLDTLKVKFKQAPDQAPDLDPGVVDVQLLGQIVKDDQAYIVYRSTTSLAGTKIHKVSPMVVKKADPEWDLVIKKDNEGIKKLLTAKLEKYTKMANDLYKAAAELQKQSKDKKPKISKEDNSSRTILNDEALTVYKVVAAPDGKKLASRTSDELVRIWDFQTGKTSKEFKVEGLHDITYSDDGKKLAISGDDKILIWDVDSQKTITTIQSPPGPIITVAFSPDGKKLVSGGGVGDFSIKLWDVKTGKLIRKLHTGKDGVVILSFSPDGKRLLSFSSDNEAIIWEPASGKKLNTFSPEHESRAASLCFSPDGKLIVSAGGDKSIKFWDPATGKLVRSIDSDRDSCLLTFSPDGKRIASASSDHSITLLDALNGKEIKHFTGHQDWLQSLEFTPDGKNLVSASGDGSIKVWDLN